MAPEQAQGGSEVDRRADIWAFGVVLYEMLTGHAPFVGDTAADTLAGRPDPRARLAALPAATPPTVRPLLGRCIERDAEHASARHRRSAGRSRNRRPRRQRWAPPSQPCPRRHGYRGCGECYRAVTAMLALALFAVWWTPWRSAVVTTPLHLTLSIPGGVVEAGSIENLSLAISRDGQSVVYCARDAGVVRLYIRRLDRRDTLRIARHGRRAKTRSSPRMAVGWASSVPGSLRKVAVEGGSPTLVLADAPEDRSGVWLDDDRVVFVPSFCRPPEWQAAAAGGVPRAVTTIDTARNERMHRWPAALPGGDWVPLFTIGMVNRPNVYDDAEIGLVSMTSGERRTLFTGGAALASCLPIACFWREVERSCRCKWTSRRAPRSASPCASSKALPWNRPAAAPTWPLPIPGRLPICPKLVPPGLDGSCGIHRTGADDTGGDRPRLDLHVVGPVRRRASGARGVRSRPGIRTRGTLWVIELGSGSVNATDLQPGQRSRYLDT